MSPLSHPSPAANEAQVTLSDLGLEENDLADLSEKAWLELPAATP